MGGIFGGPKAPPPAPPPPPPAPPVVEATVKTDVSGKTTEAIKKKALGTKQLQVPLVNAKSGLGIPGV